MKKFCFILIALILSIQIASANVFNSPQKLEYIVQKLPQFEEVNCKFKQQKSMPNNVVLNSSGDFHFDKNSGVIFKTTSPIKAVNSYSSKEYNQINDIINAIANRKYSRIENQFDFYFINATPWQFAMKPKSNSQTSKYLKSIEITGSNRISKMVIITTNAVKTTIWFYD